VGVSGYSVCSWAYKYRFSTIRSTQGGASVFIFAFSQTEPEKERDKRREFLERKAGARRGFESR
jgi:hypothetical protein